MVHYYVIPLLAALGCAVCNGTAAVLQKVSADKEKNVSNLDARLLWRLFQDKPYLIGIALDLLGWVLTIIAVHYLPLFLVEAVIAASIVVTALIERIFRHRAVGLKAYAAIGIIVVGLGLLALSAAPERARPISNLLRWLIVLAPGLIALVAFVLARRKSYGTAIGLAILSGLAFGCTSVIGRIFTVSRPLWHTTYNPLIFALIASGVLGILLFSIALQRALATVVSASMTASQTLIPAIVGILFLGDEARNGLWYLVVIGTSLTLGGITFLALSNKASRLD